MKKLVLVGGSGSIGDQVIDIVLSHPSDFQLIGLAVGTRVNKVLQLQNKLDIPYICVAKEKDVVAVQQAFPKATIFYGDEGLVSISKLSCDLFVNALVGFVGLKPTLTAIESGNDVALANKESLVVGGELVWKYLDKYHVNLYPIDSEHSAIWQCLQGNSIEDVDKLIITASGGSFRDKTRDELTNVTAIDALKHPNWSMGSKITIDSATMMNKGFEVIEAHFLFHLPYNKIETILHRQSIVHSFVQYKDHSILAQLGVSDMRIPIQYALTYPHRETMAFDNVLDLKSICSLTFEELSFERYPLLKLAYEVGEKGGILACIMNGANEECVYAFLEGKIAFLDIEKIVYECVHHFENHTYDSYNELYEYDCKARDYARQLIERNFK